MPRGDGTGPAGMGPMTGRGAGFCTGFRVPGRLIYSTERGLGFGHGSGYRRALLAAGLISGCAYLAYRWSNRNRNN